MKDQFWGDTEKKELPKKTIFETHNERINANNDDYNTVDTQDNKIFFYSGVSRPKVLKLNKAIDNLNTTSAMRQASHGINIPIRIHINSYGGSVFAGLAAVDYIKTSKAEVHTIIDGCAASAASRLRGVSPAAGPPAPAAGPDAPTAAAAERTDDGRPQGRAWRAHNGQAQNRILRRHDGDPELWHPRHVLRPVPEHPAE